MNRNICKLILVLATIFSVSSMLLVAAEAGSVNKNAGLFYFSYASNEQFVQAIAVIFLITIWFVFSLTLGFGKSFGIGLNRKGLSKAAIYLLVLTLIVAYQAFLAKRISYVFAATPTPTPPTLTDSPDPQTSGSAVTFQFTCSDGVNSVEGYVCKDSSCTNCLLGTTTNCWCASGSAASNPSCTYTCPSGPTSTNTYYGRCRSSAGQYTAATAATTFTCQVATTTSSTTTSSTTTSSTTTSSTTTSSTTTIPASTTSIPAVIPQFNMSFWPVSFSVDVNNVASGTVGEVVNIPVRIQNLGILADNYTMNMTPISFPEYISLENNILSTNEIKTNGLESVYFRATILAKPAVNPQIGVWVYSNQDKYICSSAADCNTVQDAERNTTCEVVSHKCAVYRVVEIGTGLKSMPEIGLLQVMQIFLIASVIALITFK